VVRQRAYADVREPRGKRVDLFSGCAVDDARLAAVAGQRILQLALERRPGENAVHEVRSVERTDQFVRPIQSQLHGDVPPHARRGRGGECVDADTGQPIAESSELPVLRAEVVTPLADAMRFVYGDEAHLA
jgi:hypothetical protein